MSTTSLYAGDIAGRVREQKKAASQGVFGRFLSTIMKAREAQAHREVNRYLARQSDRMLRDIGMSDSDIVDLRAKARNGGF